MIYHAIRLALGLCTDFLVCWIYTKILTFRSKRLFVILYIVQALADVAIRELKIPLGVHVSLAVPLIDFCLPILLSTDGLRTSFVRTLFVNVGILFAELMSASFYALLSGGKMVPTGSDPNALWQIVLVYTVVFSIAVPVSHALIDICNRTGSDGHLRLQVPLIALLASSYLQVAANYVRFTIARDMAISFMYSVTSLAFCWTTALIVFLIFTYAVRESHARKELAQRAIVARQVKHERIEIEAIAQKAELLYKLRHSLANQMRAIANLAEAGHVEEADMRLSELQKQARTFTGSTNE